MESVHAREDAHNHKALGTAKSGCSTIRDLDVCSEENVEGRDAGKKLSDPLLKLDHKEIQITSAGISQVRQFLQHDSSNMSTEKKLGKSATFPCSDKENGSLKLLTGSEHSSTVPSEGSSNTESQLNKNYSASKNAKNAACQRSWSFPSTITVVSALKGSREKQGQTPKEKLCVKWAPDVYDPPVTSASHTVKNYQQRHKPKKDKHRKSHKNGKSSRGNANEKKQASRNATMSEPPQSAMVPVAVDDDRLPPGTMRCGVDMAEYAAHCQESKYGGSFLARSLSKISSPIAEAS